MQKKGQGSGMGLAASAIAIVTLIIMVILGANITQTIRDNVQLTRTNVIEQVDDGSPITVNTSMCAINLDFPARFDGLNPAASGLVFANATGVVYQSGNYTSTASTFTWTSATGNNTALQLNYTVGYDVQNYDYNVSTQGLASLVTYSNFFAVIIITVVFAVIIGMF